MTRLLYISPGPVPPSPEKSNDPFSFLSEIAEGEVLLPVWWRSSKQVSNYLKRSFPQYQVDNFCYHMFLKYRYPWGFRRIATFLFYLFRGLQLHWRNKIDVVMCYGTHTTGVAAALLAWLTGAKLIVELPNVPEDQYQYQHATAGKEKRLKLLLADYLLNFVGRRANCIALCYPWQLRSYPSLQSKTSAVVPSFVAVRRMSSIPSPEKYILLMGFPWFTKGADLLITAFRSIAADYPDFHLKLMGHYPERGYLEELARGCPQIEFLYPRPNEDAMWVMSRCSVYVLASRTDAAPKVVREAMAASKPVIASAVGGVPYFIIDNDTGLLFEPGNVSQLAEKLRLLLDSPELRARLGRRAYEKITTEFDEKAFVRSFEAMLQLIGIASRQPAAPPQALSSRAM